MRWHLVSAAVLLSLLPGLAAHQNPSPPAADSPRLAVLRVQLDPYDDSAASLRQIDLATQAIPPRRVTLPAGGSLSALVLQEYGFGPSNLPNTYRLLQTRILELNGASSPEAISAGPLLIPNLPSRVKPNLQIAANAFPAVAEMTVRVRGGGGRGGAKQMTIDDLISERVQDTSRLGATATVIDVPLQAHLLKSPNIARLLEETFAGVASAPMTIRFGQDPCKLANPAPPLTAPQSQELAALMASAQRSVPVFIIDSGWPSEALARSSQAFLAAMLQDARKRYRLPPVTLPVIPFTKEPVHRHAVEIEAALQPFKAADPQGRVQTIYVPMSLDQGSAPILQELIEVADIVRRTTRRFGPTIPSAVPPDIRDDARRHATAIVAQLSKVAGDITETDKAIVESVITLAASAARDSKTFYVVNESWSVAGDVIGYAEPANPLGVVVAAVGNDSENVIQKGIDFAQRSLNSNNFVAVMNVDSAGQPVCKSSFVAAGIVNKAAVLGYSGAIAGGSATSYATPRISWLLAAAEAVRPVPVDPTEWRVHLRDRLLQIRGNPLQLSADPVKLVRLWMP